MSTSAPEAPAVRRIDLLVREVIRDVLPHLEPEEIPAHSTLKDLGADSVDRVEIVSALIDRLGIDEPMARFSDLRTVGDLVTFLATGEAP